MSRFRGSYDYSIDEKGRVSIPAKFRKMLRPEADETFVIVRGPNNCLQAYPLDAWSAFEEQLDARPLTPETVRLRRYLYKSSIDAKLDNQGRIALSPKQMETAGIAKRVVLEGQGAYIELWSPENYERFFGTGDDFDQVFYQSVQDGIREK